jgi:hypothetical protein
MLVIFLLIGNSYGLIVAHGSEDITQSDFAAGSFSKTIDLFEYVREHAETIGGTPPPVDWNSKLIVNYVNQNGVKVLYMGFAGVDYGDAEFQIPLQSIVERFNTTKGEPAMTASSFLMLMAFNDTKNSLYTGSPDKGDNLWASFTMGTDYSALFPEGKTPRLKTSVEVTPMKVNSDKSEWTWGMTYKDLAAMWWNIAGSGLKILPSAFCIYDELGFNYRLVYNKSEGTAKIYVTYSIGEMRDLWTIGHISFLPVLLHYNNTGTYNLKQKLGEETLHDFLERNKICMSIVMTQRTWVADKEVSNKIDGIDASSDGVDVSSSTVQSTTSDGQKVFAISFGEKKSYKLDTEDGVKTYNTVTRIADVNYYAKNSLLKFQNSLLYISNALVEKMFPVKYADASKVWMNSTKSDYLYITSYPTYSGYAVTHDPVYTAYFLPVKTTSSGGVPIPDIAVVVGVGVVVFFIMRRRH